jgi:hypothetical protein
VEEHKVDESAASDDGSLGHLGYTSHGAYLGQPDGVRCAIRGCEGRHGEDMRMTVWVVLEQRLDGECGGSVEGDGDASSREENARVRKGQNGERQGGLSHDRC